MGSTQGENSLTIFRKLTANAALFIGLFGASVSFAAGCVEDIGETITVVENGKVYQVGRVVSYIANIAPRDLTNSRGTRLTSFAAILQQDRANLHKSGKADGVGDFVDGFDPFFTTLKRRTMLSTAVYYHYCYLDMGTRRALESDILNGRVLGVVWVNGFYLPNGKFAVALSQIN